MNPERRAFLDAIDAAPGDVTTRLVFADWLNESNEPAFAEALRLAAKRKWEPIKSPYQNDEARVAWYSIVGDGKLPNWLFLRLPALGRPVNSRCYSTYSAAWLAFGTAFRAAVEAGEWPRSKLRKRSRHGI